MIELLTKCQQWMGELMRFSTVAVPALRTTQPARFFGDMPAALSSFLTVSTISMTLGTAATSESSFSSRL